MNSFLAAIPDAKNASNNAMSDCSGLRVGGVNGMPCATTELSLPSMPQSTAELKACLQFCFDMALYFPSYPPATCVQKLMSCAASPACTGMFTKWPRTLASVSRSRAAATGMGSNVRCDFNMSGSITSLSISVLVQFGQSPCWGRLLMSNALLRACRRRRINLSLEAEDWQSCSLSHVLSDWSMWSLNRTSFCSASWKGEFRRRSSAGESCNCAMTVGWASSTCVWSITHTNK